MGGRYQEIELLPLIFKHCIHITRTNFHIPRKIHGSQQRRKEGNREKGFLFVFQGKPSVGKVLAMGTYGLLYHLIGVIQKVFGIETIEKRPKLQEWRIQQDRIPCQPTFLVPREKFLATACRTSKQQAILIA